LGAVLNLNAPYLNSIKYDYQALPFLSLLAASLVTKSISLFDSLKSKKKMGKLLFFSVGLAGLLLVAAAIFLNINYTHQISTAKYLLFRVVEGKNVGYSLIDSSPVGTSGFLMNVQYLGFAVVLSGLFWAGKRKIYDYLNVGSHELYLFFYNLSYPMRRWIEEKSALSQAP
jgi:hypothetical protein